MAERNSTLRDVTQQGADAFEAIRGEVDRFVQEMDFRGIGRRLEEFGKAKPVALAFAALTIGMAAGVLMRRGVDPGSAQEFE